MADDRKRAIALKAADARGLLQKHLPYVLHVLTPAQLAQVQRVLDAEVVNPEVAKQANEVYRKSVTAQSGNLVLRDQKTVDRAYRIMATQIKASESDQHIRLDYKRLLTVDALTPVTDNPDEREYLGRVRNTLENKGIWLRFDNELGARPGRSPAAGSSTRGPSVPGSRWATTATRSRPTTASSIARNSWAPCCSARATTMPCTAARPSAPSSGRSRY